MMIMQPHLAWIRLDPVATLDHLQTDTKALEAALAMKPQEYLVVIDHLVDYPEFGCEWCRCRAYLVAAVAPDCTTLVGTPRTTPPYSLSLHSQITINIRAKDTHYDCGEAMSLDEEQYLILKRQEDAMRRNQGATLTSGSSHSNSIAGFPSCGSSPLQPRSSDPSQTCGTGVNGDISSQLDDPPSNTVTLHAYEECPWPPSSLGEPYDSYGFDDDGPKVEKRLASKEEILARATEAKVEGRSSLPNPRGFCAEWSKIKKIRTAALHRGPQILPECATPSRANRVVEKVLRAWSRTRRGVARMRCIGDI
ncbi:hypothetical protein C8Q76DRAFT_206510 [Earliella scabrosa]|nr:hypothetical protein C8Q76DRAFT_206510 [Earliella scabrosa]